MYEPTASAGCPWRRGAGRALTLEPFQGTVFGKMLECGDSCHSNRNDCFSIIRNLTLALVVLALIGWNMIARVNNSNALVQHQVPDYLRGRVMGILYDDLLKRATDRGVDYRVDCDMGIEPAALQAFAIILLVFAVWSICATGKFGGN